MRRDNYMIQALRTESELFNFNPRTPRLLHVALGLASEVGELSDSIKKNVFYGEVLDVVNLKEEIGDIMWYLALLLDELGTNFAYVQKLNINKLKTRFPDKFTQDKAKARDLKKERSVLEGSESE